MKLLRPVPGIESVALEPGNGVIKLHILLDQSIVEVLANRVEKEMTDLVFPAKHEGKIELVMRFL